MSRGCVCLSDHWLVYVIQQILIPIQIVIIGIGELIGLRGADHLVEIDSIVSLYDGSCVILNYI